MTGKEAENLRKEVLADMWNAFFDGDYRKPWVCRGGHTAVITTGSRLSDAEVRCCACKVGYHG